MAGRAAGPCYGRLRRRVVVGMRPNAAMKKAVAGGPFFVVLWSSLCRSACSASEAHRLSGRQHDDVRQNCHIHPRQRVSHGSCCRVFRHVWHGIGGGRPALIDDAVADAPDARPVLGDAEQGRWLVSIHPQALALDSAQQVRGTDNSTDPAVGIRFAVDLPARLQFRRLQPLDRHRACALLRQLPIGFAR
jgi:hypothetical protein